MRIGSWVLCALTVSAVIGTPGFLAAETNSVVKNESVQSAQVDTGAEVNLDELRRERDRMSDLRTAMIATSVVGIGLLGVGIWQYNEASRAPEHDSYFLDEAGQAMGIALGGLGAVTFGGSVGIGIHAHSRVQVLNSKIRNNRNNVRSSPSKRFAMDLKWRF